MIGARTGDQTLVTNNSSAAAFPPGTCETRKMTIQEALAIKVKIPWEGKVQPATPDELTKEMVEKLERFGLSRREIRDLFGFKNDNTFYKRLKKLGIAVGAAKPEPVAETAGNMVAETKPDAPCVNTAPTSTDIEDFFGGSPGTEEEEAEEELLGVRIYDGPQRNPASLESVVLQAARELGGMFPAAGLEIGLLVKDKNAQYGDTITSMGPILKELYPEGIKPEAYDNLAVIVRIIDKLGRISKGNGEGGEDAWKDIAGYGLLGSQLMRDRADDIGAAL